MKGAIAYSGEGAGRTGRERFGDIDYSSWGPRLGFAYSFNDKRVIRAGYGTYYSAGNGLTGGFCIPCSLGFTTSLPRLTSADGFIPALYWDNGFVPPAGFIPPPFINPGFANALNHTNYTGIRTAITAADFGRIIGATGARTVQLNGRISF